MYRILAGLIFLFTFVDVDSIRCYKAVGTKSYRPSPSNVIECMSHVTSCYTLQTKEDVVGHMVEGSEFDCDNENACSGMEGACMTMEHSVRCCCTHDLCNTAKRTVIIGAPNWKVATSSSPHYAVVSIIVLCFFV